MRYRPAELSDQEAVVDAWLSLAVEQRRFGSRIDPEGSRAAVASHLATLIVDGNVIVAESEGSDLVGLVVFNTRSDPLTRTARVGSVEFLYVDPDRRGHGIGTELLDRAEEALAEAGVEVVDIEALEANEGAIAFYEQAGYRRHRIRFSRRIEGDSRKR